MIRPTWDEGFMFDAIRVATRSSCLVRQVGAVLVKNKRQIASGYNGAPPDVETCLDTGVCFYQNLAYEDSLKGHGTFPILKEQRKEFCVAIHAEKNAINQCSRGEAEGSTLYTTNYPCPPCVRDSIIPYGVAEIVVWKEYLQNKLLTMDEYEISKLWLSRRGIKVRRFDLSSSRMREISEMMFAVGERLSYQFEPKTIPIK